MKKIIVTHGIPTKGLAPLQTRYTVIMPKPLAVFSREELWELLPQAEAVLACGALEGDLIRRGTRLQVISNYGAGYDRVDVQAATDCGIPVTNIPDATAQATAELAMALLLGVVRRVGELNLRMRQDTPESLFGMGKWMGHTLRGMRLGIVGMGRIGLEMARLGRAFGMEIRYHNRHPSLQAGDARYMPTLEALARESDVLSIHCPLSADTKQLVHGGILSLLPPGAVVINTARGAILDHEALAALLREGRLWGAGLDVYPDEPHVPSCLLELPQVVLTPHVGTNCADTRDQMALAAANHILEALEGKQITSVVNPGWEKHPR